jgi:hypothetical protein
MLTGDEELRAAVNSEAAGFPSGGACRSEERVWELDWWGQLQGSSGRFYRARRGKRGRRPGHWPSIPCERWWLQGNQGGLE